MLAQLCVRPAVGVLAGVCLLAASSAAIAQGTRPAWMPDIPLSPAAVANGVQRSWEYGHEFVTVNVSNNAALPGLLHPFNNEEELWSYATGPAAGRGTVSQPFRISRFETTNQNWRDFMAAVAYVGAHEGSVPYVTPMGFGNSATAPMLAGPGVTWRTAAIYCNWLHNGQALTRDAFMNGAYDVSTFGNTGPNGTGFSDQITHNPDARFWIPTWDQWLAAAHYDGNRNGPGQGGWWAYPTTSDVRPIGGPPGTGESNTDWGRFSSAPYGLLLGSYPNSQSAYGLLDASGFTGEWTEEIVADTSTGEMNRYYDGSYWFVGGVTSPDRLAYYGTGRVGFSDPNIGFRIAAYYPGVPTPSSGVLIALTGVWALRRRRFDGKGMWAGSMTQHRVEAGGAPARRRPQRRAGR